MKEINYFEEDQLKHHYHTFRSNHWNPNGIRVCVSIEEYLETGIEFPEDRVIVEL